MYKIHMELGAVVILIMILITILMYQRLYVYLLNKHIQKLKIHKERKFKFPSVGNIISILVIMTISMLYILKDSSPFQITLNYELGEEENEFVSNNCAYKPYSFFDTPKYFNGNAYPSLSSNSEPVFEFTHEGLKECEKDMTFRNLGHSLRTSYDFVIMLDRIDDIGLSIVFDKYLTDAKYIVSKGNKIVKEQNINVKSNSLNEPIKSFDNYGVTSQIERRNLYTYKKYADLHFVRTFRADFYIDIENNYEIYSEKIQFLSGLTFITNTGKFYYLSLDIVDNTIQFIPTNHEPFKDYLSSTILEDKDPYSDNNYILFYEIYDEESKFSLVLYDIKIGKIVASEEIEVSPEEAIALDYISDGLRFRQIIENFNYKPHVTVIRAYYNENDNTIKMMKGH